MPGEIDRYNMRRLVSITANVVGTDLGKASKLLDAALAEAGTPPQEFKLMFEAKSPS